MALPNLQIKVSPLSLPGVLFSLNTLGSCIACSPSSCHCEAPPKSCNPSTYSTAPDRQQRAPSKCTFIEEHGVGVNSDLHFQDSCCTHVVPHWVRLCSWQDSALQNVVLQAYWQGQGAPPWPTQAAAGGARKGGSWATSYKTGGHPAAPKPRHGSTRGDRGAASWKAAP